MLAPGSLGLDARFVVTAKRGPVVHLSATHRAFGWIGLSVVDVSSVHKVDETSLMESVVALTMCHSPTCWFHFFLADHTDCLHTFGIAMCVAAVVDEVVSVGAVLSDVVGGGRRGAGPRLVVRCVLGHVEASGQCV